jgi:hypothetical protein
MGSNHFAGSYHFCTSVNIFDQIEISLWNTSDTLSLQCPFVYVFGLKFHRPLLCMIICPYVTKFGSIVFSNQLAYQSGGINK